MPNSGLVVPQPLYRRGSKWSAQSNQASLPWHIFESNRTGFWEKTFVEISTAISSFRSYETPKTENETTGLGFGLALPPSRSTCSTARAITAEYNWISKQCVLSSSFLLCRPRAGVLWSDRWTSLWNSRLVCVEMMGFFCGLVSGGWRPSTCEPWWRWYAAGECCTCVLCVVVAERWWYERTIMSSDISLLY